MRQHVPLLMFLLVACAKPEKTPSHEASVSREAAQDWLRFRTYPGRPLALRGACHGQRHAHHLEILR